MDCSSRKPTRRWLTLGGLAVALSVGSIVALAEKQRAPGSFESLESGINHAQMVVDSHHICGVGWNSLLGHYTMCIALKTPNSGVIEYQFEGGNAMYGTVQLKNTTTPSLSLWDIQITGGSGQFQYLAGQASGTVQAVTASSGVQSYTAKITGVITSFQPRKQPPNQQPE